MFHCFLCILCNTNLLLTFPVVVTSILIVHFDIWTAFCPKCFLIAAGGSGGRKLQERGNEPNFDSRFGGGVEATANKLLQYRLCTVDDVETTNTKCTDLIFFIHSSFSSGVAADMRYTLCLPEFTHKIHYNTSYNRSSLITCCTAQLTINSLPNIISCWLHNVRRNFKLVVFNFAILTQNLGLWANAVQIDWILKYQNYTNAVRILFTYIFI